MISLFKIFYSPTIIPAIQKVFESGTITEGQFSDQLEQEFGQFINNENCALTNSCTSALMLAYRMAKLKINDEVISTPMTCMATNAPIMSFGAKIVWSDIDPRTGNIDPDDIEKKITKKTKAISFVHWAGQPCDLDRIRAIGDNYNIPIIEDCAHAIGASYHGQAIGIPRPNSYACFSFQAIKHLTTVDGGAIACSSNEECEKIRKLKWFGLSRKYTGTKWEQDITDYGYKFHMNNITAVIGLEHIKHIRDIVAKHQSNSKYYDEQIDNPKIQTIQRLLNVESAAWIYSLLVDDRVDFEKYMQQNGIGCDRVHVRNDTYTVFKQFKNGNLPGLDEFSRRMTNIPVGWWVTEEDRNYIVQKINEY